MNTAILTDTLTIAACAVMVDSPDGQPPKWVEIMPAGTVRGVDGRGPWTNNDPASVVAASIQPGRPLPMDFNHQTVFAVTNGGESPAAGWIDAMEIRDGAIWASVDWTKAGSQALTDRAYRYVSPTFRHDPKTGAVHQIVSVALVNVPNIAELPAVASQIRAGDPMDKFLAALRKALGLSADATQDAILQAVQGGATATATASTLLAPLAADLGLAANAQAADVVAAARGKLAVGAAPDPSQFVPMSAFTDLQAQVADMQAKSHASAAATAVEAAVASGKVSPAMVGWATEYASRDLAGFGAFITAAPVIVPPGGGSARALPPADGTTGGALSDTELAICSQLGVTPEAFTAARKKETV